jgi:ABC-type lipoprotein release transport system permease subunit
MAAVRYRLRAELRARWKASLAVAILVGVGMGLVTAALAGGRRTDTAYSRFLSAQHAADVLIPSAGEVFGFANVDTDALIELPQVAEAVTFRYYVPGLPSGPNRLSAQDVVAFADREGEFGTVIDRRKILEGRAPDPDDPLELSVSFVAAERFGLDVGEELELSFFAAGSDIFAGEFVPGATLAFDIVGIDAAPQEFPPLADQTLPPVHLTPAFDREYRDELLSLDAAGVRLERGARDIPAFKEDVERLAGGESPVFFNQHEQSAGVQRSIHVQAQALRLIAALVALVVLLVVGQAVARQILLESRDVAGLRAIGMSRSQVTLVAGVRAAVIGLAGGGFAIAVALALSPLTPIGLARKAEIDPGVAVDGPVIALVSAVTLVFVIAVAAVTSWWSTRRVVETEATVGPARTSRVVGALARASFPVPAVVGVRMALEPGRGRTAVPLRTTLFGATLAVVTVVGAMTFSASLAHLLGEPRLYGVGWDLELGGEFGEPLTDEQVAVLADDDAVGGLAVGTTAEVVIGGETRVPAVAMDREAPPIGPTVIEGREPLAPDEILLGSNTLRAVQADIGDRVAVGVGGRERPMQVVGRGVLPVVGDGGLGRGAFLTFAGLQSVTPRAERNIALVNLAPGVEPTDALRKRLREEFTEGSEEPPRPTDLVNFGRVDAMPTVIGALLAVMAAAGLVHALVTAVRRRSRDIALLETLGFVRGQVVATVAWQASTIAVLALIVGVPVGVGAGRWAWGLFADGLGVVDAPIVPLLSLLLVVPGALALANLVAAVPALIASRTRPAAVLRAE